VGGALLAADGIRRGAKGIPEFLAGALLMHRGITGKCEAYRALGVRTTPSNATIPYELGVMARAEITIAKPRSNVYALWRDFENLPRFMPHLVSVDSRGGKRTHWVAKGPMGKTFEWDAEIINDIENDLIAWKSLPGADVDSAGSVRFTDTPAGTKVLVEMQYNPPAGVAGAWVARLFGNDPEQTMAEDLRRIKRYLETGQMERMPEHVMEEAFT
jgi:uncharacterized membrane protein